MLRRGAPRNLPRASCPERHTDLQRQRELERRRGCPTDDASAEEVLDDGQVEPTLARWHVDDVGAPDAVGKMRLGVPLQDVRGGWQQSIRRGRPSQTSTRSSAIRPPSGRTQATPYSLNIAPLPSTRFRPTPANSGQAVGRWATGGQEFCAPARRCFDRGTFPENPVPDAARTRSTVGAASAMSRVQCSAVGGRPPTRWSSSALSSDSACTRNWMWIGRELERRRLRRSAEEFERLAHEGMQAR